MEINPISKISSWLDEARKTEISDPEAVTLATVDNTGSSNVRTVLLRVIENDSFVFFTNYTSSKVKEIENNN